MSTRTRITEDLARGCREAGGCGLVPLIPTFVYRTTMHYYSPLPTCGLPTLTPLSPEGPRTTNSMTKLVLLLLALLVAPALSFDVCGNFCGPVRKRRGEGGREWKRVGRMVWEGAGVAFTSLCVFVVHY